MKKLFVVTDGSAGLRLISAAQAITAGTEFAIEAVSFGETVVAEIFSAGARKIRLINGAGDDMGKALALQELCRRENPEIVLFPSTVEFRCVAPMLAAMLHTGLTADCISLSFTEDGLLRQTRPALSGSVTADILCPASRPQMATIRENAFPPPQLRPGAGGEVIREGFNGSAIVKLLSSLPREQQQANLSEAKVIVSGGKGIGAKDGFDKLRQLAALLPGAMVGASRGAVSATYAPYEYQVGLTGEYVRPAVYLAFGISGAVQHLAGMKESATIIAVNTDRNAPIFDYSDIAVVAPWSEVADGLIAALSKVPYT